MEHLSFHLTNVTWGWLAVAGSAICFGSFGVPIKTKAVLQAKVDPVIFQSYKTFWVLVTSFLVLTYNDFVFTPWGIVSGISWVPASVATVISITLVGLGIAQGIFNSLIVAVSFSWGAFYFKEPLRSIPLSALGIFILICGVFGMAISRTLFKPNLPEPEPNLPETNPFLADQDPNLIESYPNLPETKPFFADQDPNLPDPETNLTDKIKSATLPSYKTIFGYSAAIFNGLWGGSVMVPLKFAGNDTPTGIEYIVSFAIGSSIVNLTILVIYSWIRVFVFGYSVPSLNLKVMAVPGFIAGTLWALGNFFSIYAVLFLGEAVGYPSVQTGMIIGGLWGIFYYKELKGWQIAIWMISAATALGGIVLLSQMKK
eukprot:TRINITY_DN13855_c0_g1_i1.p1 TRINITY_DN13855_c0_g1~~TRINITY_DN13855_c0_g1_i1.p1  ORF type:complete len:371 (-),score=42.74 TRINITY_DN13855_c0_g1_i1:40-1152(-)